MNKFSTLLVDHQEGITTVSLNRPELHNAFNDIVVREVTECFVAIGQDLNTRAVVLTGSGKSFSAGADLNWMRSMVDYSAEENKADALAMAGMFHAINHCPRPVIGKIKGAAIGGGAGLTAVCDIAVATEKTVFAFSEVRLGIIPAVISPYVIQRIGKSAAREYFLTGGRFKAPRAQEIGLINYAVSESDLDEKVADLCFEISQCGPEAVSCAKELIFGLTPTQSSEEQSQFTAELIATRRASTEGQQGMQAFLNKKSPPWNAEESNS